MPRTTRKTRKQAATKKQVKAQKQNVSEPAHVVSGSIPTAVDATSQSPAVKRLSGVLTLTKNAILHIWRHKRIFAILAITYLVLNLLLVRGFVFSADIGEVKGAITDILNGTTGQIAGSLTAMGLLVNSLNPTSEVAALYQSILVIVFSMFFIWTLRQTYSGEIPKARDVFYRSSYPLVQFMVIIFVLGLQLLPFTLGSFLYTTIVKSATSNAEVFAVAVLVFLLAVWSLYMLVVSLVALYIVTLPDMTPLRALRSAKGLVGRRRWTVMRKMLFLPVALTVIGFGIMVPVIIFASSAAEIIFLVASAFVLPLAHGYMYSLYRELLA